MGRDIRLVAPSGRHTAPRCSKSCKPHGVAFSGYCSLRGRVEAVEVFDPCVVKFAGLFNQQQIYAGHSIGLGAKPVNCHALIPTKYVNGQVIQLLHFWDLRDGRGGINPLKVQPIFGGVPSWSLWVMWWWWICQSHSKRPSKTVVIPVFHVDNCLLRPYSCWEWDVRAASQ